MSYRKKSLVGIVALAIVVFAGIALFAGAKALASQSFGFPPNCPECTPKIVLPDGQVCTLYACPATGGTTHCLYNCLNF